MVKRSRKASLMISKTSVNLKFWRTSNIMSEVCNPVIPGPSLEADLIELLKETLQATLINEGLPRCSTPIPKSKQQPKPTSYEQDNYSRFVRRLEGTGVAPKLRGSGKGIRGVLSGHMVMYRQHN
nr:unnamed protein product [Callosobruchus chinensis]